MKAKMISSFGWRVIHQTKKSRMMKILKNVVINAEVVLNANEENVSLEAVRILPLSAAFYNHVNF